MHRNKPNRMSDAEIMVILILFHSGGSVVSSITTRSMSVNMETPFPRQVSYNRFVELEKEVLLPMTIFIKEYCWELVPASVSLTPLPYVYAVTKES